VEPNPFNQVLLDIRQGSLHAELSEHLQELVATVAEREKPGTLTLTLKVSPAGRKTQQYEIADDVTVRPPKPERGSSLFFALDGNLSRSDPRQPELPLREVPAPPSEVQEVER
jgi:hypothetical protein